MDGVVVIRGVEVVVAPVYSSIDKLIPVIDPAIDAVSFLISADVVNCSCDSKYRREWW